MKKELLAYSLLFILITSLTSCNKSSVEYINNNSFQFVGAPSGNDTLSSSTNHSGKGWDTIPKLNGVSGTAYVKPPEINNYGTVNLSYHVDIPAGRAGLQPGVALSYSSSGGDGLAGIGWSLGTGLGVISRTTAHGQLYYDNRDTFTCNGKRLIKVEGPSNSENGTYRLEIESGFSRFELTDAENGGVWRVYDKSGTVTLYGEEKTSRIYRPDDANKTYIWNFSRGFDLNGNFMYARYDVSDYDDNHILYLSEIRYTGNYNENMQARQYVKFHYKERSDFYVTKAPGFIMKMTRLLDIIEVGWDTAELWRYEMVYEISDDSNRPLLKGIESTGSSTQPGFVYQPANHYFVWQIVNNPDFNDPEVNPEATKYFEGDFNGDGISDMVFFNPETGNWKAAEGRTGGGYNFKVYGNGFRGYDSESEIIWFKENATGEYNGDGRSDIAFYLPGTGEFIVAEHNGYNFEFRNYGKMYITGIDIFKCEWFTGDYDGNGLSDVVLFNEPEGEWILMSNTGGSFEFIKFSRHFKNLFRDDYNPDMNMDSEFTSDNSEYGKDRGKVHFLSGDYNGDGRTDVSIYDSRSGMWWVAENYREESPGFKLEWKLYKIFSVSEKSLFSHDRFSGDYNGDGFSDFLLFDRESGEWIIGETGDGTIQFRIFSNAPQFREITRWLQGDFNGDGRTDIGFFSKTDCNFWIGEATPDGFRYRVYNNLSFGPDTRVLETPLPEDEVKIRQGRAVISDSGSTSITDYQYDGNYHADRGESLFTGSFTGTGGDNGLTPEFFIYKRIENRFIFKQENGDIQNIPELSGIDLDNKDVFLLNNGVPGRYRTNHGIIYYKKESSLFGSDNHLFNLIYHNGTGFTDEIIAEITGSNITDFSIRESFYLVDHFNNNDSNKHPLILDDKAQTPRFLLFSSPDNPDIITIAAGSEFSAAAFQNIRNNRSRFRIFSGRFTALSSEPAEVLLIDMTQTTHRWYLGVINNNEMCFSLLSGNPSLYIRENQQNLRYHVHDGLLIYSILSDNRVTFYRVEIEGSGDTVIQTCFGPVVSEIEFNYGYDHKGNPVVYTSAGVHRIKFGSTGYQFEMLNPDIDPEISSFNITRPDLMENVYGFRWLQGDYNGDSKTDIGIFHLKERAWYFAVTEGTVPDIICRVRNGIGGNYEIEYVNSTAFDNTDDDGIPDLPMNYKICSKLTIDDGRGNRIWKKYEYKNGYAFSAFINGKKETDYFGFGEFRVLDAQGGKTKSCYHNVPFDDFRKNRALAGAVKESLFIGSDSKEYGRTEYEYKIHEILQDSGFDDRSYLTRPVRVRKYMRGVLVETRESNIELGPGKYEMNNKTDRVTDHYQDPVHTAVTLENYNEYENIEYTNEMRLLITKSLKGTSNETTTEYEYDEKGNLIAEILRYSGSGLDAVHDLVMSYEYDAYGNRIKETNSSGSPSRIIQRYYDSELHQFLTENRAIKESGYLSTRYIINYASAFGNISEKTGPNGNSVYFEYDDLGRLSIQRADTDFGIRVLNTYSYNAEFPLSAKVTRHTGTGDIPISTSVYIDGLGRVIHIVQSGINESGKMYTKSGMIVYDELGRVTRKSQAAWAGDEEIDIYSPNTREKYPTLTEYDADGRVKRVIIPEAYPGEPETSITYIYNDPWEVIETHSIGRSKRTVRNSRGQTLYIEDSGKGDDGIEVNAKFGFAYDTAGNRIKKMDLNANTMTLDVPESLFQPGVRDTSGNNITCWKYDGFGRVAASSDPDLGCSGFIYNEFGDITSRQDALNRTTSMSYDMLGRLTEKILPGIEGSVIYTYDSLSGSDNGLGKIVSIDDPVLKKGFSYDRLGRVKREAREIKTVESGIPGGIFATQFEHDLLNRKKRIFYPEDPVRETSISVEYSHLPVGIYSVSVDTGSEIKSIVSSIDYNEFGQIKSIVRGNGTFTNHEYDIKGRLTSLFTTTAAGEETRKLQDVTYSFKIDNSIISTVNSPDTDPGGDNTSGVQYNYSYDGLNRLVHAQGAYTKGGVISKRFERGYSYAANGNLTGKTIYNPETHAADDRWSYTYSNHAVTNIHTTAHGNNRFVMQYDAAGNMIFQEDSDKQLVKEIEYNSFNRIKSVINPDINDPLEQKIGRYWYDDQGFRIRKLAKREIDGRELRMDVLYPSMYFGIEMQRELDGTVIPDTEYSVNNIYMNGVRIAAVLPGGEARYYLTDQVDSVKVVVDDDGRAVSRMEYLPYGETWFQEGDTDNNPKYNSQELDKETNFYYYNARHYDPEINRFVTADTVIDGEYDSQGWNRFSYVKGNPIVYKDPTGHWIDKSKINWFKDDKENVYRNYMGKGTVTKDDNLWNIAKKTLNNEKKKGIIKVQISDKLINSKVNWIKTNNNLKSDKIKPGQKLWTGYSDKNIGKQGVESSLSGNIIIAAAGVALKCMAIATVQTGGLMVAKTAIEMSKNAKTLATTGTAIGKIPAIAAKEYIKNNPEKIQKTAEVISDIVGKEPPKTNTGFIINAIKKIFIGD